MEKGPDFELVCSLKFNDTIPIYKCKSTTTGLNVYFAEFDGPLVRGFISVATEAFDDDGLAHTLEHLVGQGSEKYPWKGVLDRVAVGCLSAGTEALTNVDHTLFKITTAGAEGFRTILPIYLENILYPTLTDSAYLTEVHHVTEEGEDGGVIYAEMQARENTKIEICYYELMRAIYPGKCGYKANHGGLLKNLRERTNNERVRNFHKEFYVPENLTVVITGRVDHTDLFEALRPLEEKIVSKGDRGPFRRFWQTPVPPLTESVIREIYFPSTDEDHGLVYAGWRGPSVNQLYDSIGCELLLEYLSDHSDGPLQREFCDIDDPHASFVETFSCDNSETALCIAFGDARVDKIPLIRDNLVKVFRETYESGIDTERMKNVIRRLLLKMSLHLESVPANAISGAIILHALYGNDTEKLEQRLNPLKDVLKLAEEPESYWLKIFKRYLIDPPMVLVKGLPSREKQDELAELERNRIAERIEKLGKEGLEQKGRDLQEAVAVNATPIPDEVLKSIPFPGISEINFHRVKSYTTDTFEQHPLFDATKLPLYTYLDDYNTNFIHMTIVMDTSPIDREARLYLPLLLDALTESPVERNGILVPYEEIVDELRKDTISYSADTWHCHSACLRLELELSKYDKGVKWIKELLYDTKLTVDRLKMTATKRINAISLSETDGSFVLNELMQGLRYNKDSDNFTSSFLRQQKFLTKMMERLTTEDGENAVLTELEAVKRILTARKNIVLSMSVSIDKLTEAVDDVYAPWTILGTPETEDKNEFHVTHDWKLLNRREDIPIQGCVMGLGCVESAYLSQCTSCLVGFEHSDFPAMFLCTQYFVQTEGVLWKQILGQGLAYGVSMAIDPESGLLHLNLIKATNIVTAYKEVKAIIETHLNENNWDCLLYDSAKSALTFGIIDNVSAVGDLVNHAFAANFKNVSHDYNSRLIRLVNAVSIDDLNRVAIKYLKDLFDPEKCTTTVVCHSTKADGVAEAFQLLNHDLQVFISLDESYLNDC